MSRLSFDIEMNTQGYVRGAEAAAKATNDVKQATKEYLDDFGSLRKQLGAAKKEAQNLAVQFSMLSATEKKSEFGKELKHQMDLAIEKAAELQDVMADTQQAIKNSASDTQTWDALKESMEIGKSATLAYAGAVAKLTGNEEDLAKLVKTLTVIENTFNTAIKIGNALQQQSAIMTNIRKVQLLAAARAEEIGTATTKGATIAQKAFNAVAKANPYVLLATVAIAAATAIGGYMVATKKSTEAEKQHQAELKKSAELWDKLKKTVATSVSDQLADYEMLRQSWLQLKTTEEKNKFLDENKTKFQNMGFAIDDVNELEQFFVKNTTAVVKALKSRAEAEAWGEVYKEKYKEKIAKDTNGSVANNRFYHRAKEGDTISDEESKALGIMSKEYITVNSSAGAFTTTIKHQLTAEEAATVNAYRNAQALKAQGKETAELTKLLEGWTDAQKEAAKAQAEVPKNLTTGSGKGDKTGATKETKTADIKLPDYSKIDKEIRKNWEDFTKKINKTAQETFDKNKKPVAVYLEAQLNSPQNIQQAMNKISKAMEIKPKIDFEIPDNMKEVIDSQKDKLAGLLDALTVAEQKKVEFANAGDTAGVTAMNEEIQKLTEAYDENSAALEANMEKAKNIASVSEAFKQASDAVGAFGDMFSALGEATDSAGLKVMGIIAQAIATIALSFAQALASCKTWVEWLAFGISGMSTMIAMISQIRSVTAGGYAEGGVVPGISYTGDKLLAKVNSGERILTAKQNENLEKIANGVGGSGIATSKVTVTGIVRGKDLMLVQKNYNSISSKAGQSINI